MYPPRFGMEFIFEFRFEFPFPEGELETECATRVLVWSSRGFALGIPNSMHACAKDLSNNACKARGIEVG
jgi:hypothetical protein